MSLRNLIQQRLRELERGTVSQGSRVKGSQSISTGGLGDRLSRFRELVDDCGGCGEVR